MNEWDGKKIDTLLYCLYNVACLLFALCPMFVHLDYQLVHTAHRTYLYTPCHTYIFFDCNVVNIPCIMREWITVGVCVHVSLETLKRIERELTNNILKALAQPNEWEKIFFLRFAACELFVVICHLFPLANFSSFYFNMLFFSFASCDLSLLHFNVLFFFLGNTWKSSFFFFGPHPFGKALCVDIICKFATDTHSIFFPYRL